MPATEGLGGEQLRRAGGLATRRSVADVALHNADARDTALMPLRNVPKYGYSVRIVACRPCDASAPGVSNSRGSPRDQADYGGRTPYE